MKRDYFGKELSLEDYKGIELEILKNVVQFCEQHGLRYFLADGTLLGAVRHKGFIPWDDDIDIRMPRPDYNKLIQIFNSEIADKNYFLVGPEDDNAHYYFVKIFDKRTVKIEPHYNYKGCYYGVDIDVFPIDGAPDDLKQFDQWSIELRRLNKTYFFKKWPLQRRYFSLAKDYIYKRVRPKWKPFCSAKDIAQMVRQQSEQYVYGEGKYVSLIGMGDRYRVPYSCFADYIMIPFEDAVFRAPAGYDEVLRAIYGDYMKLPPAEEQVTHHDYKAYRRA